MFKSINSVKFNNNYPLNKKIKILISTEKIINNIYIEFIKIDSPNEKSKNQKIDHIINILNFINNSNRFIDDKLNILYSLFNKIN
jgi:hypothetical protein